MTPVDLGGQAGSTSLLPKSAKVVDTAQVSLGLSSSGDVIHKGETPEGAGPAPIPPGALKGKPTTVVEAKPAAQIRSGGQKVVLSYVVDGDTAVFKNNQGSDINCRIYNIDAPEVAHKGHSKANDQAYGPESKKSLQQLVQDREVSVRVIRDKDKYGRSVCQVEVEGKDVGVAMASAGAAWAYQQFGIPVDSRTVSAESQARRNKSGLWANPNAQDPRNFR